MSSIANIPVPLDKLDGLSDKTRGCLTRLAAHEPDMLIDPAAHAHTKLAAVLVLLYEDAGALRVLLTTRAKTMRTHPGETALPGGKMDAGETFVQTALREAYEEIGLPLNSPHVHVLCTLRPFVSASRLIVGPVVAFLSAPSYVLPHLKASETEVYQIFSHPFEALLDPELARGEELAEKGGEHWAYEEDLHNFRDIPTAWLGVYRLHRFRASHSPVKGLTAEVLLDAAELAYGRKSSVERWAPDQLVGAASVKMVLEAASNAASADVPSVKGWENVAAASGPAATQEAAA
ncbi:hypothetical protein PENSPDRAFT_760386 [Peniophora sp. CONT]|nr:hypothetical protein PENSPDRAFT_760386 [Peniophora sp. CONT]